MDCGNRKNPDHATLNGNLYTYHLLSCGDSTIRFQLSESDKQIFEALHQFIWIQGDLLPLIFNWEDEVYTDQGITLITLKHLEAIGLISFDANGFIKKGFGRHARLFYYGKATKIGFLNDANNHLDLGHVLLTARGKELASLCKRSENRRFYEYVIRKWFKEGFIVSSIQIGRTKRFIREEK
jgi:hypothetical protein